MDRVKDAGVVQGEAGDIRINRGNAADIPYMKALVISDTLKADSQQTARVEGYGMAQPRYTKVQFHVRVRVIIHPKQVDDARGSADRHEAWYRWRPVICG